MEEYAGFYGRKFCDLRDGWWVAGTGWDGYLREAPYGKIQITAEQPDAAESHQVHSSRVADSFG